MPMNIGIISTNYKTASLHEIESVHLNRDLIQRLYNERESLDIEELVVLVTCNRIEIYFVSENIGSSQDTLIQWISEKKGVSLSLCNQQFIRQSGATLIEHLFAVVSGIDSMVLGENEILSQVKDAYILAQSHHATGSMFNKLFQTAIAVGKRARSETEISRGAYSISSIAIEVIRETILEYFEKKIVIIGLGVMGKRALKKLLALGHPSITVTNRTDDVAKTIAEQEKVTYLPYLSMLDTVHHYDIILIAVNSQSHILTKKHFQKEDVQTSLILDLGLPRNASPAIKDTKTTVVSVDGLKATAEKNIASRLEEVNQVKKIISDEIDNYMLWLKGKDNVSVHSTRK